MGLLSLTYTRPKRVDQPPTSRSSSDPFSETEKSDSSVRSDRSGYSAGIPDSLSFDKIVNGGTCPPMTLRDFMSYLIYVEHAAENLQFYLWYRDYERRFNSAKTTDIKLAPEWTRAMQDETVAKLRKEHADKVRKEPESTQIFKGTDFEERKNRGSNKGNPFNTPPQSRGENASIDMSSHTSHSMRGASYQAQASEAFQAAGARQPFTIQPFREEINRVIVTYIMDGAPRQLNLSATEQKTAMQAMSFTTHPSAFRVLIKSVDSTLRHQAHPNFVRWSICNGNPARVFFARALGVGLILIGVVVGIILALSDVGRGYRALTAFAFVLGISTLVAAYKGMCVVLHGMHHRHVRPWELFVDGENMDNIEKRSFESLGSFNSYEDEPWVVKYKKRNVVRKVFDREVWVQEPALRQIQDTIFLQSLLASFILGGILTTVFIVVPAGGLF